MRLAFGIAATSACAAWLVCLASRRGARRRWPAYGTLAAVALLAFEALLVLHVAPVPELFTALAWSAYIPLVDAAVYRRTGDSLLHSPARFTALALVSVPAWLLFEAYNLRLANWTYRGVPRNFSIFALGAAWAFATIWPGIFETAELIHSRTARLRCPPWRTGPRTRAALVALGATCLLLPLLLPRHAAAYWFGPVWAGFLFLLDPILFAQGAPSLLGDFTQGRPGRFLALLAAGGVCGFLWEFWNYWAIGRWVYVFPILQRWRVFAMPVPGFLGFPPFALECFVMAIAFGQWFLPEHLRPRLLAQGDE